MSHTCVRRHKDEHSKYGSDKFSKSLAAILAMTLFASVTFFLSTPVLANPEGGQVSAGEATISTPEPNTVLINQTSDKAVIDWRSFNIAPHETTRFQQPSSSSIVLNRVDPNQGASIINGALSANGQVWILNPAGVFFGSSARVDVAGLLATTAGISNQDFMAGNYHFVQSPDWNGAVINNGEITVKDEGIAMLVAPGVENNGVIKARLGKVVLAAANEFTVDFYGDQLINFGVGSEVTKPAVDPDGNPLKDGVSNKGKIIANGGTVLLTAKTAGKVLDNAINMSGYVIAKTAVQRGGKIILMGEGGKVKVTGKLIASGKKYGQKGGVIRVSGKHVQVTENARINASGYAGGGEILIGGDYQGKNPSILNAESVFVGSNVKINADAMVSGNGGKIIVWADNDTRYYGKISVRGGAEGGNGGFIETSGKFYLDVNGISVDARAPNGLTGTWLLDPTNIYIANNQSSATTAGMTGTNSSASTGSSSSTYASSGAIQDSLLLINNLTNALASANVIVTTTNPSGTGAGNIFVIDPISWSSANTLTLKADNNIQINAAITTGTGASALILEAAGAVTQSAVIGGSGGLTIQGTGTVTLSQANTYTGTTTVSSGVVAIQNNTSLGTTAGATSVASGAAIHIDGSGLSIGEPITLIGSGVSSNGALRNLANSNTWTGAITLGSGGAWINSDAGTLTISTGGITGATQPLTIGGAGNTTISAIIGTTTGTLTKTGAGTLTLTGANTYSGATALNQGAITLSGAGTAVSTAFTVNQGTTLTLDNNGTNTNNRIANALTMNGGEFAIIGNAGASTSETAGTLVLTLNSGYSTITVTPNASQGTQLTFASVSRSNGATVLFRGTGLGGTAGAGVANINFTTATGLSLTGGNSTATNKPIVPYAIGDTSATGTGLGFVTHNINPASNVANTTGIRPLVLASEYALNAALTANANIRLTSNQNSPNRTFNSVLLDGGNLNFNTNNTATITSGALASKTGNVTSTNSATRVVAFVGNQGIIHVLGNATNMLLQSNLTGTAGFVMSGTGTLTLETRVKAITGNIFINSGTMVANFNDLFTTPLMTIRAAGTYTLNSNMNQTLSATSFTLESGATSGATVNIGATASTLTLGSNVTHTVNGSGAVGASISGGTLALGATRTFTVADGTASNDLSITSLISGTTSGITKAGAGTLALSGANTFAFTSGVVTINAGTLSVGTIGNGGVASNIGQGGVTATNLVLGGGTLRYTGLTASTNRAFTLTAGTTSTIEIASGAILTISGSSATATTGALIKGDSGGLTLSGTNVYSGGTTINGGTLRAGVNNALGAGALTISGGTYDIDTFTDTVGTVTLTSGSIISTGGTGILTGTSYDVRNGTISAIIAGAVTLTKSTTGAVILSGANTYSGATSITGGTLAINSTGGLGSTSSTTISAGATLDLNTSITNSNTINLNGTGFGGNGALTFSGNGLTISNPITLQTSSSIGGAGTPITMNGAISGTSASLSVNFVNAGISLPAITLNTSGSLNVIAGGSISQSGVLTVPGTSSFSAGANPITLNAANVLSGAITLSNSGANDVSLTNSIATVLAASSVGQNLTISSSGAISQTGALVVPGVSSFSAGANAIDLSTNGSSNNFTGAVSLSNSGTNNVTLTNSGALVVGTVNVGQALSFIAGSHITQSGAITATGGATTVAVTAAASDIFLDTQANNFGANALVFGGTQSNIRDVSIRNTNAGAVMPSFTGLTNLRHLTIIFNNAGIAFPAVTLTSGGNLSATAGGAITQSAAITVPGTSSFTAGGNPITLNSANAFTGAITLSNSGTNNISIVNNTALSIAASNIGSGTLSLTANGAISQTGAIVQASGAGNVTLSVSAATSDILLASHANNFSGAVTFGGTQSNIQDLAIRNINSSASIPSLSALTNLRNLTLIFDSASLNLPAVTLSGDLTATSGGSFTQSGAIIVNGGDTLLGATALNSDILLSDFANNFGTGITFSNTAPAALSNIRDIAIRNTNSGAAIPSFSGLTNLRNLTLIFDNASLNFPAVSLSGNLTATAGGSITQTGAILASGGTTTLGVTSLSSDILLSDFANDFGTGIVFSNTSPAALSNIRDIAIRNTNNAAAIPSFTGLTNLKNLTLTFNNAAIAFPAVTLTNGGSLSATAGGNITQTGAIVVPGTASFNAGANTIDLSNTGNSFTGAVSLSNSGANNVTLTNSGALVIGTVNVGQALSFIAGSHITQSGAITATGGVTTVAVTAAASDIFLDTQANNFGANALVFGGTQSNIRDVSIRNTNAGAVMPSFTGLTNLRHLTIIFNNTGIAFPAVTLTSGGNLSATAGGAISQSGVLTVPGTSSFSAGTNAITLNSANALTGTITLSNSGANDVSLTNSIATVLAASSVGQNLTISSGGAITQSGVLTVPGSSSFSAGANTITLSLANNFSGAVSVSNSGTNNVSVVNSGALQIGTSTVGQNLALTAGGNITQTGAINSSNGTLTAIVTAASSNILLHTQANNLGAGGIVFGGTVGQRQNIQDVGIRNTSSSAALPSFSGLSNLRNFTLIFNNAGIAFPAVTLTNGGSLAVTTGGAITQTGKLTVPGTASFNAGANPITLSLSTNDFFGAVSLTNTGANDVSIRNSLALELDTTSVGQNFVAQSAGVLTQIGALTVPGTSSFITTSTSSAITLTHTSNHLVGAVSFDNAGTAQAVSITNDTALILNTSAATGDLTLIAGGSISQIGAIDAVSGIKTFSVTAANSDILLASQANDFGSNVMVFGGTQSNIRDVGIQNTNASAVLPSFTGLTNLRNLEIIFTANNVVLPAITLSGNLAVTGFGVSPGAITQSGDLVISGTSSFTATTGTSAQRSITLTNAGNQFTGAVSLTTNGNGGINLVNSIALSINTSSVGNGTLILEGAGISQIGAITQADTGAVTLTGNAGVINLSNSGNSFLGTLSVTNSAANSVTIVNSSALSLGNFTLTNASNLSLTGVGVTQVAGTTINAGSGTISINAGGGAIQFNTGTLTTTNSSSSAVQIVNATTVALGTVSASSGTLTLGAGNISGAITQNSGTTITVGTLLANTGSSLVLGNAGNSISSIGNVTTNGVFTVTSSGAITVSGNVVSGGNNIALTSTGLTLSANKSVNAGAGSLTINVGTGIITLDSGSLLLTTGVATLTANDMVFDVSGTPSQIGGSSAGTNLASRVILEPGAAARTIGIAGGAGLLALSAAELNTVRATNVRIGNSTAGAITINAWSPVSTFASSGVLTLRTAGAITQGGAIDLSAANSSLLLRDASSVTLTTNNIFNQIAANIAGDLSITNAATKPLTVTSLTDDIGTVVGITAPSGVTLTSSGSGGSITVNQNISTTNTAISLAGVDVTLAASITLNAGTNNLSINAGSGTLVTGANSLLYSRGVLTLTADMMTLNGTQIGGGSTAAQTATDVIFNTATAGTTIGIAGASGTLQLTNAALDTVKSVNVQIGNNSSGAISIAAWTPTSVNFVKAGVLTLATAGSITQTGAINLLSSSTRGLLLRNASSVVLTDSGNVFDDIAASISGSISLTNAATNPLTVASLTDALGTVNGITAPNGVTLNTSGVGGSITIGAGISTTNNPISLTGAGITLNANNTINAGNANISFNAGTNTLSSATSTLILSTGTISLITDNYSLSGAASSQIGGTALNTGAAAFVIAEPFTANTTIGLAGAAGVFTLTDTQLNRIFAEKLRIGNNSAGNLIFAGYTAAASFATSVLTLETAGTITQSGAINFATSGSHLILRSASSVVLDSNSNNIFNSVAASISGPISILNKSGSPLTVASLVDDKGTVDGISASGAVNLTTLGAGGSLTLNKGITSNNGAITLSSVGFTQAASTSVNAGSSTISINVGGGAAQFNSGALTSTNSGTAITIQNATTVALGNITANSGTVVLGSADISDAVTQNLGTSISALNLTASTTSSMTLNNSGNSITGTASLTNSGANDVSFTNSGALLIGTSNIGRAFSITAGGHITQSGTITATGGATTVAVTAANLDILLSSQANNFGANALVFGGTQSNIRDVSIRNTSASSVMPSFTGLTNLRNLTIIFNSAPIVFPAVTLTSGGNLSATAGGAISQSGVLTVSGASIFSPGGNAITLNASNAFSGAITLSNSGANDVSLTNSIATVLAASTVGQNLTISSGGAITQNGVLTVPGTSSFSAGANAITLNSANVLTGAVSLSNSGATNDVSLTNSIATVLAASTVGQNLTINSSGAITQSGVLTVSGTSSFSAGGNAITLNSANAMSGAITLSNSGANDVSLTNSIATVLAASTVGQNLTISSGGAITQNGVLTVPGTSSFSAGANAITLNSANVLTGAVSLSNSGATNDVSLTNSIALLLGSVSVGHDLALTAGGHITQNAAINASAGTVTVAVTAAGSDILLGSTQANNLGANALVFGGTQSNIRDVNLRNTNAGAVMPSFTGLTNLRHLTITFNNAGIAFPAVTLTSGGNLSATAGGAITQTGAITVPGTSSFSAGANATTLNSANAFTGAVTLSNSGANNISITNNTALSIAASTIGSGTLALTANGSISQTGAIIQAASAGNVILSVSASASDILLGTQANNFSGAVTFGGIQSNIRDLFVRNVNASASIPSLSALTSLRNLTLIFDTATLNLPAVTLSGDLTATSGGSITQSGAIIVNGDTATVGVTAANSDILLSGFANDFGTGVLFSDTSPAARSNIRDIAIRNIDSSAAIPSFSGLTNLRNLTLVFDNASLNFPAVTLSGNLTATAGGSITQSGAIVVNGGTTTVGVTVNNADILLADYANDFGTGVVFSNTLPAALSKIRDISIRNINAAAAIPSFSGLTNLRNLTLIFDNSSLNFPAVTLSGNLTATAGGSITQTGAIVVNGGTTTFGLTVAGADILVGSQANDFGTGVVFSNTSPALLSNIRDISIRNINAAAAIPSFSGLTNLRNLTLIFDNASLNFPAVTLSGNLTATAGGSITQTGAIVVNGGTTTFGLTVAGADILVGSQANDFGTGVVFSNTSPALLSNIRDIFIRNINAAAAIPSFSGLTNLRNLTLTFNNAALSLPTLALNNSGNLTATAGGAITQTGIITVPGTASFNAGANAITLNLNNNFSGAVSLSNSGAHDVSVKNSSGLVIGTSNVGQALSLTAGGSISQTGAITATGGATTVTVSTAGSDILLGSQANDFGANALSFGGTLSNIRDVNFRNVNANATLPGFTGLTNLRDVTLTFNNAGMTLSPIPLSGNLNATAGGALTQSSALTIPGSASFNANSITLTNSSNSFTGAVSLTAANNASVTNNGALQLGTSNVSGLLTAVSTNAISQSGSITAGNFSAQAATGITLNGSNSISQFSATNSTSGNIALINAVSMIVSGITQSSNGSITIVNSGTMTVSGNINSAGGAMNLSALSSGILKINSSMNSAGGAMNLNVSNANGTAELSSTLTSSGGAITFSSVLNITGSATVNGGNGAILFNGAVSGSSNTLSLQNSSSANGKVTFNQNVTLNGLTTFAQPYQVVFNGSDNTFSSAITFNNTNGITLGNAGTYNFNGGLTSTASTTTINGVVNTSSTPITLGAVTLDGNSGMNTSGGNLVLASMSGGQNDLTLNTGSSGDITFNGNVTLSDLTVENTHDITNNGTLTVDTYVQKAGNVASLGMHSLVASGNISVTSTTTTGNFTTPNNLSVTGHSFNGIINVGSLSLNVANANLTGSVGGSTGAAGAAKITFVNPATANTLVFDGIILNPSASAISNTISVNPSVIFSNLTNANTEELVAAGAGSIALSKLMSESNALRVAVGPGGIRVGTGAIAIGGGAPGGAAFEAAGTRMLSAARAALGALPQASLIWLYEGILLLSALFMGLLYTLRDFITKTRSFGMSQAEAISFSVRTSLTNIIGFAEVALSEKAGAISATQKEYFNEILTSSMQLQNDLTKEFEAAKSMSPEEIAQLTFKMRTSLDSVIGFGSIIQEGKAGEVSPQLKEMVDDMMTSASNILQSVRDLTTQAEAKPWSDLLEQVSEYFSPKAQPAYLKAVSFDLRTALNNIMGFAQIIMTEKSWMLSSEQKDFLNDILANSTEISDLSMKIENRRSVPIKVLSNFSFKLRTLLEGIMGFSNMISTKKAGPISEEFEEYLNDIMSSANDILQLVNDMPEQADVNPGKILFAPSSSVSFDMRTQFNNIIGYTELMLSGQTGAITADQKEYLTEMLSSAVEMQEYLAQGIEDKDRLLVEVLAPMSFKLRTSLDGVMGFARLINEEKAGAVSAEHKEYLEYVLTSSKGILRMLDNISKRVDAVPQIING